MPKKSAAQQLDAENRDLRARLATAEATLREVLSGESDALYVSGTGGAQIFTLKGADQSYRTLIENMSEGALTLTPAGLILYANRRFAQMLKVPLERVIGSEIHTWVSRESRQVLQTLLRTDVVNHREELALTAADGLQVPVNLSVSHLILDEIHDSFSMIVTDLTEQKCNEAIIAAEKRSNVVLEQAADANQVRLDAAARQVAILNALPLSIALLDSQGEIISVNETWQQFGCANSAHVPRHDVGVNYLTVCDEVQGDDAAQANQAAAGIRAVLDGTADTFSLEYPCHSPTEQRWFLMTSTPLVDPASKGVVVMHLNITARKTAENALRDSEDEFHTLAEAMPQIVWIARADGWNIYFNQHWMEYTGLTTEESRGHGWNKPLHPDDQLRAWDAWQKAVATAGIYSIESRLRRADGVYRWWLVRGMPLLGAEGNILKWFGTCTDIHDLKVAGLEIARTNAELRESERRLGDLLENVELVSVMLDREARITYCNDYLLRLTGWKREEVIGRNWRDIFVPPELNDLNDAVFAKLLVNLPEARHGENEILTRLGERRLIRWNNSVLRSGAGEVVGSASIGEDITESRRGERLLLDSEKRFRAIFDQAPVAMALLDRQGHPIISNLPLSKMVGYTNDELSKMTFSEFSYPEDTTKDWDQFTDLMEGKISAYSMEKRYVHKNGNLIWANLSVTMLRDENGLPQDIIGMAEDITERKKAEARITYLNRLYAMQSSINALIVHVRDRKELFKEACRVAVDVGGFSMAMIGILNRTEMKIVPVASIGKDETLLKAIKDIYSSVHIASNTMVERAVNENKIIVSNDSPCDPQVLFGKLFAESGINSIVVLPLILADEVFGVLAIYASERNFFHDEELKLLSELTGDISFAMEYLEAQDALRSLNQELESKVAARTVDLERARNDANTANQAKSSFLAAMSHEIRTPMNGVIGMVDVLRQTSLNRHQVEMVDLAHDSALSLLNIIDDILDFSKIEAGRLEIESAPISVANVVESACDMLDHWADKKMVALNLFVDPTIPEVVMGDALRIRQVLLNLVSNAIKFSSGREQAGRVSIRVVAIEHGLEEIGVEFQVIDNGIGMDEETKSRLFTAFTQADTSTTRRFGGTGLGLVISRHLVELMGGYFTLQSTPGMGATFTVHLRFALRQDMAGVVEPLSDVAGLSCVAVGARNGVVEHIAAYLIHDGAQVQSALDMAQARTIMLGLAPGLWIWIIDCAEISTPIDELRAFVHSLPDQEIRLVIVRRGSHKEPHAKYPDVVLVGGNIMTRRRLLKAVAIAAGREAEVERAFPSVKLIAGIMAPSREAAVHAGGLILVAEDNETNQKVILRQLALLGFVGEVADNGKLALKRWQSGNYALLLSDLHMPEMDGYELAAAIRAHENAHEQTQRRKSRIPIVAMTANRLQGEADRCRLAGMDDFLNKPLHMVDLQAILEKWLPATSSPQSHAEKIPHAGASTIAVPAPAEPVDVSVLEHLIGSDPAMISEFLNDFQISAAKISLELKSACVKGLALPASEQAHKLKSSARAVGALALGDLCEEIEAAGDAGNTETLTTLYPRFQREFDVVNISLDSLLAHRTDRRTTNK